MNQTNKHTTPHEYNNNAVEYDKMSRKAAPWIYFDKPFLKSTILPQLHSTMNILELGCGGGKVIELLCKHTIIPKNITGVDISKELISIAQRYTPQANFIVKDMTKIPIQKNYFDAIISVRSFEYLNIKELASMFQIAYASLKSKGQLYIITGHPLRVNDADITTYLNRGIRKVSLPWGMEVHLYHKTISDYISLALSAGFTLNFIDEPSMPMSFKKKYPEKYQTYMSYGGATNLHLILRKK